MLTLPVVFGVVVDSGQFDDLEKRSEEVEREDSI